MYFDNVTFSGPLCIAQVQCYHAIQGYGIADAKVMWEAYIQHGYLRPARLLVARKTYISIWDRTKDSGRLEMFMAYTFARGV